MRINKKGLEMDILLKLLIGMAVLFVVLGIIYIMKAGGENIFISIMEKLRFG